MIVIFKLWFCGEFLTLKMIMNFLRFLPLNHISSEKALTTQSSTLVWKLPWMEEPGRLQSMGPEESDMTERLHFHFSLSRIGEGNANPLQRSCLKNPMERGAGRATVHGVTRVGHN